MKINEVNEPLKREEPNVSDRESTLAKDRKAPSDYLSSAYFTMNWLHSYK